MNIKKIIIKNKYHKFYPLLNNYFYGSNGIYKIKTNSNGFRTHEFTKRKYKKNYLFLGDSFIAPDNISNNESFINLYEENKKDVILYNLGVDGTGTDQQLNIFEEYGRKIHFDELVICVNPENIFRNLRKEIQFKINSNHVINFAKDYYSLKKNKLVFNENIKNQNKYSKFQKLKISKINHNLKKYLSIKNYYLLRRFFGKDTFSIYNSNSYEWLLMKKILLEFRKKTNKKINIILIPHPEHYFGVSSMKKILNCFKSLKSENFNIINLNDYLIKMPAHKLNKLPINKFDYHFSKYGHQIIYKILRNIL